MMELSFNKKFFKENLNCKNYSNCIYMLHEEIKDILALHVKEFDNNYVYKNLSDLKNKCLKFLDYEQNLLVLEFYDLSFNQVNEMIELNRLLEIYNKIKKDKKN